MDIPTLNFDHSHHKLKIRGLKSPADVLTFTGHEQLSSPFRYDIEFTSTNKAITPESVLMQDGAFSLTAPPVQGMPVQTALRTLHGVITSFKHLSSSQDEARYEVRLEPRMALLTRSRQNAIYQNQTVPQIVEKILRERHQMRGQDFVFNLKNEYPAREQVMQYGEDDLTFVSRLLSEVGIWFRFATDARLKIEVVEFYDDQSGYERGLTLPLRHPSGLFDGETEAVWGLNSAYSVVEKSVSTRDYNYREATAEMTTGQHDATGGDNTTYGEAYHYADNFLQKGDKEAAESGAFYARIRHERYLNEQAILQGQSTSSLLMPGLEIKVQGDDAPAVFRKGVLITGVTASAARDRSYELTFTAIPYSERYGYRPALIPCPVMAGTLPARVTSTVKNDIYAHIDKDGRYRVNLDFDRDTWKPGYESLWVRQSRPYAGDTYGLHLPLLAGTEVSIAFEEGNPDRPYIAGVKHDSAHTDHVTIQNYKRNVLRTPANNKIRLDDERGKEHIKVSTEYGGKSQLNLGHLVDAGKQQRGEGFELRTDLWGTVRAKKGIFISSDAQDKAQGKVREMAPAMAILDGAQSQMKSLSTDAQTANADPADLSSQIALLQQSVKDLTQAAILLSAPKGVAIASGEHLQLAASKNLIANAGNHADIGVVKNMFIGVGQALSVFVRKAGIKLFANKGAISVQAQNDLMELLAQKSIEITSTEDEIKITAKKKITLNGGGSYIRLDACGIEAGTPGEYNVKAGYYGRKPKAKLTPELMAFPVIKSEDFNQSFILLDENTGQPLINWPYELELESGLKMSGITDENGNTELISSDKEEVVNISVFEPDEFLDDEIN
ncbi:TPA: type VI secretion system tip protein VgrG [Escherichia coli O25b:H4-ST131]|uniref:Type VI secretion system tip protein VgrG n=65 Tax=Escherichia coli TaxID=562 RepID=A0A0C5ENH0_ECOLX|nr:type VI secretion system tip protein VgrG [Escherichia coli]EEZ5632685.1 type VI secretion system tip protein VgrG [Escherichia coli O25]EFA8806500.1 type VI secretion system tip protein VgrG [Escherichia coli O39:H4]EFD1461005.1 type VI secretion system tip protein VgrG [Escherichia coli O157:H7]EFZ6363679.1 type VI secretion system tip protein VgrG [Shigella boydii]EIO3782151.1 type VI secretion system tip protein VgrG [Shigella flexneri]EJE8510439.1 type VI secretion system tip protein 